MTVPESTVLGSSQDGANGAHEGHRSARTRLSLLRGYSTVILTAALILLFSLTASSFFTLANFQDVLLQQTIVGCMALGVMFPLIVGEFDLSVGYMIGFICMVGAYLGGKGWNGGTIIVVMLICGLAAGLINGFLAERLKISSFIATLGTGIVLQGLTQGISGGKVLSTGIPHVFQTLGSGYSGWFSNSVWIELALIVVLFYVLQHTPVGRHMYAVGGSERVAFLAGLNTRRLKVAAFMLSGLLVACGAVFALGQNGSASPDFGAPLLLPAYAAVFLGVTTYRAGTYNVIGTTVGLLLLGFGFDGLSLWGVPFWVQPVFNGGVLLLAVLAAKAESRQVTA